MTAGVTGGRAKGRRLLGRPFGWLWAAYAASAGGTGLALSAFPLIAVRVLHAGPARVSVLSAAGAAVGAAVAVSAGPWVEARRKRPVMVAMDLVRWVALMTVPAAYALGVLGFWQLLAVSVVVAAAGIIFRAASGAFLKSLLPSEDLLAASARLESTTWTATILGPPLGGLAIGLLGPVVTVAADAASYLLSALGLRMAGDPRTERAAAGAVAGSRTGVAGSRTGGAGSRTGGAGSRTGGAGSRTGGLLDGWRLLLADPGLRPLFLNTVLVNGLIMATEPLLAVLMLGRLGFAPWQFGLAFALPCVGGLAGSRLAGRVVTRFGQDRVMRAAGALRACWPVGLAFLRPGVGGLLLVVAVEFALVSCMGVFNPVVAAYRLDRTPADRVARVLSAWTITGRAAIAALTALWGLLAAAVGPRAAIAAAGVVLLATPLLLPRPAREPSGADRAPAPDGA
ncbi:MFS transporter [Actinacidiphila yeochonensis]|uniref:MFS transporter n=1 Tax=Actinacidiphila yeochonensis TaxID=89050 RepID=UPI00068B97A1